MSAKRRGGNVIHSARSLSCARVFGYCKDGHAGCENAPSANSPPPTKLGGETREEASVIEACAKGAGYDGVADKTRDGGPQRHAAHGVG